MRVAREPGEPLAWVVREHRHDPIGLDWQFDEVPDEHG